MLLAPLSAKLPPDLFPFDYEQKEDNKELNELINKIYEKMRLGESIEEEISNYFRKNMKSSLESIFSYKRHPNFTIDGLIDYIFSFLSRKGLDSENTVIGELNDNARNTASSYLELLCWIIKDDWNRYSDSAKRIPILHIITSYLKTLLEFIQYYDIFFTKFAYLGSLPKDLFFEIQDFLNNSKIWVKTILKSVSVNSRVFVNVTRLSPRSSRRISKTRVASASSISQKINILYEKVVQGFNLLSKLLWAYLVWNSSDYDDMEKIGFDGEFDKIPQELAREITSSITNLNTEAYSNFFRDKIFVDTIDEVIAKEKNTKNLKRDIGEIYYFSL